MKPMHRALSLGLVGSAFALLAATGCTIKSDDKFVGTPDTYTARYRSGGSVSVSSVNGPVTVGHGSDGVVTATYTPFVLLAYDTSEEDARTELEKLLKDFQADTPAPGSVTIGDSRASGASTMLGATIDVALPPEFDGPLSVYVKNGSLNTSFVGAASAVDFRSDNGSIEVTVGASARTVNVNTKNGSLSAELSGVPADSKGGSFVTGNGDITLHLPGRAKFSIQAQAMKGGVVNLGNATEAGCVVVEGGNASAQTVSCGGATATDPLYQATAAGLGDVNLSF